MANKKKKKKQRDQPVRRQYVYHAIALLIGIVFLFVICFVLTMPPIAKMVGVVLVVLVVGTYLRRFSLTKGKK